MSEEAPFWRKLQDLINKECQENGSDTPDFILAHYMDACLKAFNSAVKTRDDWHKFKPFKK